MGGKPGTVEERLFRHIMPEPNSGCWLWVASLDTRGYGQITVAKGRSRQAYRVAYELVVGPVPAGLELDHKCRVRSCCNPDHLEPVTHAVNMARSANANRSKTHCKRGHPFTPENTYSSPGYPAGRQCRTCMLARSLTRKPEAPRKSRTKPESYSARRLRLYGP